jgi:hypothetical protein
VDWTWICSTGDHTTAPAWLHWQGELIKAHAEVGRCLQGFSKVRQLTSAVTRKAKHLLMPCCMPHKCAHVKDWMVKASNANSCKAVVSVSCFTGAATGPLARCCKP